MRARLLTITLAFSMAVLGFSESVAAVRTVYPDGAGLFPTIQAAVDASASGDTVLLFPGTYTGVGNRGLEFRGVDIVLRSDGGSASVFLDCEYQARGIRIDGGETAACIIEGLTIERGLDPNEDNGGGILCYNSSPRFNDIVIRSCEGSNGGGVEVAWGSPTFSDVVIEGNTAYAMSGGIDFYDSNSTLANVVIRNNHAHSQAGGAGIVHSDLKLQSVVFEGNQSPYEGGGIYFGYGECSLFIEDCSFIGNQSRDGAGIYFAAADSVYIANTVFQGNIADRWGGAIRMEDVPSALIQDVLMHQNQAHQLGGISINYSSPVLRNVTIAGNTADEGAGVGVGYYSTPLLDRVLIAFNGPGQGIWVYTWAEPDLSCCDIYANFGGNYSGIGDQTGINGNISEDPLFCDLEEGDLTVARESPCLPANNDCGVLIGAFDAGCTLTGAAPAAAANAPLLLPAHPNPFNPTTTVRFELPVDARATLRVFDLAGRMVRTLIDEERPAGAHAATWDGRDDRGRRLASGVYLCRLDAGGHAATRKLVLAK